MEDVQSLLQDGLSRHQTGDYHAARTCYEAVLAVEPDNIDGNFLLGTLLVQTKDYSRAEMLLKNTLRLKPDAVPALVNLGMVRQDQHDFEQALRYYRAAHQLEPNHLDVLNNLATLLIARGDDKEAEILLMRARAVSPFHVPTLFNSALLARQRGNTEEAIRLFQTIFNQDCRHVSACKNLVRLFQERGEYDRAESMLISLCASVPGDAELIFLRGEVRDALGRTEEADKDFQQAMTIRPNYPEALFRLAMLRHRGGAADAAIELLKQAIGFRPDFAEAYGNLCFIFTEQGRFAEAKQSGEAAVRSNPRYVDGYTNLGVALFMLADFYPAHQAFENALTLDPNNFPAQRALAALYHRLNDPRGRDLNSALLEKHPLDAALHWNRALYLLENGELPEGWDEYEWGLKTDERLGPTFPLPYWQGEPLDGKVILAVREQGVGDELMFVSCIPDLADLAARVIVGCDSRFVSLFKRSFPSCDVVPMDRASNMESLPKGTSPDFYVRVGSLPRHFRRDLAAFPARDAYLVPSTDRLYFWRGWLSGLGPGLKVGICWRSGLRTPLREGEFTELNQWEHPFRVLGIVWVNVQYGECEEELRNAESLFGIKIHRPPDIDQFNQLDDVSALIAALDVVVTAGTSVHVIAGGVGTATLMLGHAPIMSLGTPTEPWFKRVEQIREYEKLVTLRLAARCLEKMVSLCCDKFAVNAVFSDLVRTILGVPIQRPVVFVSNDEYDCGR